MKRSLVAVIFYALAAVACALPSHAIKNDDDASDAAERATVKYKLSPLPVTCLYFDTSDKGKSYLVRVREKHSAECGGDLNTSPSLIFLNIRKSDGHVTKMDIAKGTFEEIK